jgi:putative lipase involved disintegration of autophagic bodies
MELLQSVLQKHAFQDYFLQYGVLGIVAFVLGYFALQQYKSLVKKNDKLEEKIDRLQDEMMTILVEERDRLAELIKDNTAALTELQRTIFQYLVKKPD